MLTLITRRVCVLLVALSIPAEAVAAPPPTDTGIPDEMRDRITKAEASFRVQNYPLVVELLQPLQKEKLLEGRDEHLRVLQWLGASHWFVGSNDAALLVFTRLLKNWPDHRLDQLIYPAALVSFFDARRQDLLDLGVINQGGGLKRVLVRRVVRNNTPWVAYFAPFGVGQFVNDQPGKGMVVAILQTIGLITTTATWLAIEPLKVNGTNRILESDEGQAKLLNGIWIAGAIVFASSYAFSVVDGFVQRPPEESVHEEWQNLRGEELPDAGPQVRVGPGPGAIGVGMNLTF